MKSLKYSILVLLSIVAMLSSCKNDEDAAPSEQERVTEMLTAGGTWTLSSAKVDGTERSDIYAGLTINFTSTGFTTTNGGELWPASGTWHFESGSDDTIVFDNGMTVTVTSVSEDELHINFEWTEHTFEPGRLKSIPGEHVFVFTR